MTAEAFTWRRSATPRCPRCAAPAALAARFAHGWRNAAGERVEGVREALLCRGCDAEVPAARALLAGLAAPGGTAADLGPLVADWLAVVRTPGWDALAAEAERWRAGEL